MKKFVILFLSIALCLLFTGCSKRSDSQSKTTSGVSVDEAKSKLEEVYTRYHEEFDYNYVLGTTKYFNLSSDKSSLKVDSCFNDNSVDDDPKVIEAIFNINSELGLPSSITTKMEATSSMDGMQSEDCGVYTVTWTYHPDRGLEVTYDVNQ